MAVEEDNFGHLVPVELSGTPQAQHMFCVLTPALVAYAGLTSKEGFKSFALQTVEEGDGRDIRVTVTAGFMLFFAEHAGDVAHQLFAG